MPHFCSSDGLCLKHLSQYPGLLRAYKHRHSHIQRVCNDATISEGIVTMSMKIKNVYTLRPNNFPLVIFLWAVLAPYTCLDVYQRSNMCVHVCIDIVWNSQASICLLTRCVEVLVTQSWLTLFFFSLFLFTRFPHPWDSPGQNTGVGCHFLLQCMKVKSESEVTQSCPTLSDPMDCSPPGSSVHGIFQARVLE